MPLSQDQIKQIIAIANEIEQSGTNYGEIKLKFKRPYWRHIEKTTNEDMQPDGKNADRKNEISIREELDRRQK